MVHTGYFFGIGLGWHSKHSVSPPLCTVTWPLYPAVPDSTRGTLAARAILLTCLLASRLSKPFRTMLKDLKKSTLNFSDFTLSWKALIFACGAIFRAASRATCDLDWPTCLFLKRNCRLRLLISMVSKSMIVMSWNPERTRVLRSSQPIPPAPTARTRLSLHAILASTKPILPLSPPPPDPGPARRAIWKSGCKSRRESRWGGKIF